MRLWWLPLLLAPGLAGCADDAPTEAVPAPGESPAVPDPWGGSDRQVLLDLDGETTQFDLMCAFGGGPNLRRNGDGRVLPGTAHIEALVEVASTSSGMQLGYVLDESPAYDEREQEGIIWLEPVAAGESQLYSIPVREDQVEPPEGQHLWHFYQRMNLPTGENQPKADCYTGVQSGQMVLKVEAVKG